MLLQVEVLSDEECFGCEGCVGEVVVDDGADAVGSCGAVCDRPNDVFEKYDPRFAPQPDSAPPFAGGDFSD
jgi:hypothetical protein